MNKLTEIQKQLKAPKNQKNNFGKYKYRSCEDILEAVKPLIPDDCRLILSDSVELIGERYYVKAIANFTDGDNVTIVNAWAREAEDKKGMDVAQITGAASSYARKYALNGLFLIDDTKDADTTNNGDPGNNNPKPEVVKTKDIELTSGQIIKTAGITGDQIKGIEDITTESNTANKELSFYLKAKRLPGMTNLNSTEADELLQLLHKFKKEPDKAEIPLEIKTQLYEAMADMGLDDKECKQFFDWVVDEHNVDPETLLTEFTEWFDKFELEFNKPEEPENMIV